MSTFTIEKLLGGTEMIGRPLHSDMDFYELGKTGIPKRSLLCLAGSINLSIRMTSRILHVTERTLQRKKDHDRSTEALSEQTIQIGEVYSRGESPVVRRKMESKRNRGRMHRWEQIDKETLPDDWWKSPPPSSMVR